MNPARPDPGQRQRWADLAVRFRACADDVEQAARLSPVAAADALGERLAEMVSCLTAAEELWQGGQRQGAEAFREALEGWRKRWPAVRAWIGASAEMVSGWSAAAGIEAGYGKNAGAQARGARLERLA